MSMPISQQRSCWSVPLRRLNQHHRLPGADSRCVVRAQQTEASASEAPVPAGCARYTVTLRKPLGIVLEQDKKTNVITVAEIKSEGSASKDGQVKLGDQLIAVSGVTYEKEMEYNENMVKMGQTMVRLLVINETMKTVSAAIGSHPGHIPVTMEFQSCDANR